MRPLLLLMMYGIFSSPAFSQVAISTNAVAADANTMLDVKSNNKGVKFPRLTSTQRKAIVATVADAGLMVFDTDQQCLYMYDGNEWLPFAYATSGPASVIKKTALAPGTFKAGGYGEAVAIDGEFAAVGAHSDTSSFNQYSGSVFMYKKVNGSWVFHSRMLAPTPAGGDDFGAAVAISGNYMVVGSPGYDAGEQYNQGAAYIYYYNGIVWTLQQKLLSTIPVIDAYFGGYVAIHGSTAVIAAQATQLGANIRQGAVYIFSRSGVTWTASPRITAPDPASYTYFGEAVAVDGDYVAIGCPGTSVNGVKAGAVYIYVKGGGTWTFQQKIAYAQGTHNAAFGMSLAINGDQLLAGAPYQVWNGKETGAAFIYKRSGSVWTYSTAMVSALPAENSLFGKQVAFKNNYVMIGAPGELVGNTFSGNVYLFKRNTSDVRLVRQVPVPDPTDEDEWSKAISFDGNNFILGSNRFRNPELSDDRGVVFFGSVNP